ncbi:hypothetical protein [Roseovarius pelagicus]|uniref:Uncharacterized protein n=1 Tax=Roseovarius pelagicus TaxID=2980108 RepID=A0ABY6DBC1_9RHOB|nr:hypothetical protein [Roseovarius pelagicus]UXX83395.1 hypothetical protein N7U68_01530 [Roseovarius pelagicus]
MAAKTPKNRDNRDIPDNEIPPHDPRTDDVVTPEQRDDMTRHPPAASRTTDAEAGAQIDPSGPPAASTGARPDTEREVRAGPGDAGASDAPRPLDQSPADRRRATSAQWIFGAGAVLALILLIALVL